MSPIAGVFDALLTPIDQWRRQTHRWGRYRSTYSIQSLHASGKGTKTMLLLSSGAKSLSFNSEYYNESGQEEEIISEM